MAVVGPASASDRDLPILVTDSIAKDAIISWFQGEFAAANAIIDALCTHLAKERGSEYEALFMAVHRRRINWIRVLEMQKYHSIADVETKLRQLEAGKVAEENSIEVDQIKRSGDFVAEEGKEKACYEKKESPVEGTESNGTAVESVDGEVIDDEDDSPNSDITDSGSHEFVHPVADGNMDLCANHEDCETRSSRIKLTKGFSAKEPVKGHMVNVVKGLKLYEDVFTDSELSKLANYVTKLRSAGQNGELSRETYIHFNKQVKGNKRELLQFGVPIFRGNNEIGNIQPIPSLLQDVVDHLLQWQLLPPYKKPNSCIVNFFDEGEQSQPFLKPPHLDQPVSTIFLNESTAVFGRFLVSDNDGNYKGPLMLQLQPGSLLVMRGKSADLARHVISPSSSKRVSITFFKVRSNLTHPPLGSVPLWQTPISAPCNVSNGSPNYEGFDNVPRWGISPVPLLMLPPMIPTTLHPQNLQGGGTGVFLPSNGSTRKPARRLPPRARRALSCSTTSC